MERISCCNSSAVIASQASLTARRNLSSLAALWEVQKLAREGRLVQQGGLQALVMARS
jgi:hypothetical protein